MRLIQRKLDKQPISSLSRDEIGLYFDHRLQNLISRKKILVRNELEYLLGETGPGNLRIDPELLRLLTSEESFTYSVLENIPEIKKLKKFKEKAENYITESFDSEQTRELLTKILTNYLKRPKVISTKPFIVEGMFNAIPMSCLIKNGMWIMPDKELFSFLRLSQEQKKFPIIMAKKISGILFPVFKGLSIMGLNTYKVYLPEEGKKLIVAVKSDEGLLPEIKYHNQFQFLDKEFIGGITGEHWEGNLLKNFFEIILKNNIEYYYKNFLQQKIRIADDFINTVSQFRKNKATKSLIENYENKQKLISELKG